MFSNLRIGHGYDVHRLVEGRRCIIGGVDIPYERGLLGHSDADVLAHALADAILGACRGSSLLQMPHSANISTNAAAMPRVRTSLIFRFMRCPP